MQTICDFFQLGKILTCISLPVTAPCLSLMKVQTSQGTYSIKSYPRSRKKQLEKVFLIKKIFNSHQIPLSQVLLFPSLQSSDNFIYEDDSSCWSVAPWVFGCSLELNEILDNHIEVIAKILAKIHKLQVDISEAGHVLSSHNIDFKSEDELNIGLGAKLGDGLEKLAQRFNNYNNILKENLVIGHGDLLPQNVIWKVGYKFKPILIDWDNAGWINQDIELFNTAINWAGVESGYFNRKLYDKFIEFYLIENARKIYIDQVLISASLGSWLNWLIVNHKQRNKKAVDTTLRALDVLEREFF